MVRLCKLSEPLEYFHEELRRSMVGFVFNLTKTSHFCLIVILFLVDFPISPFEFTYFILPEKPQTRSYNPLISPVIVFNKFPKTIAHSCKIKPTEKRDFLYCGLGSRETNILNITHFGNPC